MTGLGTATVDDQKSVLNRWAESWSAHDLGRLLPLFTEDVIYEDVTLGVVNRGTAELRAFAEGFFAAFPDVTFELRTSFSDGGSAGAEWIMRGTHKGDMPGMPATGKRVEVRGASVFAFEGSRIKRCADYWDAVTFRKQLGFLEV
jgi:steroid delta-isomerase-like uncharacterized protein